MLLAVGSGIRMPMDLFIAETIILTPQHCFRCVPLSRLDGTLDLCVGHFLGRDQVV